MTEIVGEYQVIVITEILPSSLLKQVDDICRSTKTGFIYSATTGISGFVFVDFNDHIIRDENGEECKQYIIRNISSENPGIVLIDDTIGNGKLAFSDGDYVTFKEVNGMNKLNDGVPREIKYVSPIAFSIGDTSNYGEYVSGGIVEQVKVPKNYKFASYAERLENPYNNNKIPDPLDLSKFGRNELLHVAFCALQQYYDSNGQLPELNNEHQAAQVVETARNIYNCLKSQNVNWINNASEFCEKVVGNVARWARAQIVPVTAFLGGVVAQEIVKYTGKYTPIDQWLWFDFFETVENLHSVDRTPLGSRYDDQIAIFGRDIQEKLFKLNVFMIGAGALGCEFLKEFALMGISTKNGKTTVTDNDNIEISNLNRQFLFRRDNVGTSKSKTACQVIKKMNQSFNCIDLQSRVGAENEHIFNDKFWLEQDFVINAVDNINARKYIDNMCTWYGRPLVDSGTLGTKAHVQLVIPHVTSCYNDSQDPPEESVPMCTLHNFPSMIEHCIEWGRTHFTENFTDIINDAHKLVTDPQQYYVHLKKEGNTTFQLEKLTHIKQLIELALSKSFDKCIEYSIKKFTENFDYRIQQLLYNFPADYTNNDGSKFWSGSKRVPHPIRYDSHDELSLWFISSYAILLARALSVDDIKDVDYIKSFSSKIKIPDFVPKKIKIKINDNDNDDVGFIGADEENQLANVMNELSIYDKNNHDPSIFKAHEFEKDDDTNYHIDFIHSCSNLRAENYKITQCDRNKTKMIAGKIIPAIATTTAAITGLVALQIYTLLQTNKIDYMRNVFMNLAVNLFVLTEPSPKVEHRDKEYDPILLCKVKAIPQNWSVWDKIVVNGPMTIRQFIDYFEQTYGVEVSIITCKNVTLIQTFQKSNQDRNDKLIEVVYKEHSKDSIEGKKYLVLDVSADTHQGHAAVMPLIQYNLN